MEVGPGLLPNIPGFSPEGFSVRASAVSGSDMPCDLEAIHRRLDLDLGLPALQKAALEMGSLRTPTGEVSRTSILHQDSIALKQAGGKSSRVFLGEIVPDASRQP
jgi:hypothetical protein